MLNLFIIKPHWFNKISKSANGNYNGKYIWYSLAIFFQGSKGIAGGGRALKFFRLPREGGGGGGGRVS